MLNTQSQLEKLREIALPVCQAHGLDLVDARMVSEQGAMILRVLIERPDQPDGRAGVSLADCQNVSRDLSTVLDVEGEQLVPGRYRLEVGSPGIERPLISQRDFTRFAGREIRLRTHHPIAGRRQLQGVLKGLEGDLVRLHVESAEVAVPFAEIAKASLVVRF